MYILQIFFMQWDEIMTKHDKCKKKTWSNPRLAA